MNNEPTILGKTYDYGYDGRDHIETISVPLYLDGKGYDIELNVYGQGKTAEEADIDAKDAEFRLIKELQKIVDNYERSHSIGRNNIKIERLEDYYLKENGDIVKKL